MNIISKRGNVSRNILRKHHSKLLIGFLKQIADQDAKPSISAIDTGLISFDEEEYENKPLLQKFFNNKWNGMNLKEQANRLRTYSGIVLFHSKYTIDRTTGHYKISSKGRQKLNKLKAKKLQP